MKKVYMQPQIEEIKLNSAQTLLSLSNGGVEETTSGYKGGFFKEGLQDGEEQL